MIERHIYTMPAAPVAFKFISLADARAISGHPSDEALDKYVRRHNSRNPDRLILRRHSCVDQVTLVSALEREAERHTPFFRAARALNLMATDGALSAAEVL